MTFKAAAVKLLKTAPVLAAMAAPLAGCADLDGLNTSNPAAESRYKAICSTGDEIVLQTDARKNVYYVHVSPDGTQANVQGSLQYGAIHFTGYWNQRHRDLIGPDNGVQAPYASVSPGVTYVPNPGQFHDLTKEVAFVAQNFLKVERRQAKIDCTALGYGGPSGVYYNFSRPMALQLN